MFNKFFGDGCGNDCGGQNNCCDTLWIVLLITMLGNCGCKVDPCLLIMLLLLLNCCGNKCGC